MTRMSHPGKFGAGKTVLVVSETQPLFNPLFRPEDEKRRNCAQRRAWLVQGMPGVPEDIRAPTGGHPCARVAAVGSAHAILVSANPLRGHVQ